ncbi:MAG: HAMP domain-containing protein [Leptolyngbya sp. DLM2.Bin15]|nr:MAG: HAMP domain-containing protein [Leptolyngbya sp. DLM2.Bin15]
MKIRTQSVLAILPIFISVAAINGFLTYTSEQQENRWALEEESIALTVAIAEFVKSDRYSHVLASRDEEIEDTEAFEDLHVSLERILLRGQAKYILTRSLDGQELLHHFSTGHPQDEHQALAPETLQSLQIDSVWISPIRFLNADISILESCTLISTGDTPTSILCTGISANPFLKQMTLSRQKVIASTAIIVATGFMLTFSIATLMTRKIRQLADAAETVAAGNYDQRFDIDTIQEVQDLSNTLSTMSSVMGETLMRAKRSLVENERFRTISTLVKTYQSTVNQSIRLQTNSIEIAGEIFEHNRHCTDFLDICPTEQGIYIILGHLIPDRASQLDTLIDTSATVSFLKQLLKARPCPEAIAQTTPLFAIQTLHCLLVSSKEAEEVAIDHWSYETAHLKHQYHTLDYQRPWVLTLGNDPCSDHRVENFIQRFGHLSAVDLMNDLQIICRDCDTSGIMVIIKPIPREPQST